MQRKSQLKSAQNHSNVEERKSQIVEGKLDETHKPRSVWLLNELDCLNSLTANFNHRIKTTFKKIETCQSESEANHLAN